MDSRPAALLLTPEAPYPITSGGAFRTAGLLEYLSARYQLDVIVFLHSGAPNPVRTALGKQVRRILLIELPIHARGAAARGLRNLARLWRGIPPLTDRFSGFDEDISSFLGDHHYDVAVVEHFWCAGYCHLLKSHSSRLVLDLHNIESVLHQRCSGCEKWPLSAIHRKFHLACRDLERKWLPEFSLLLTASDNDAAMAGEIVPNCRIAVYPNTIPDIPRPERKEEESIAFSANMEYHPNTLAVRHFRKKIWPLLRAEWPKLKWVLIGKNPEAVRRYVSGDSRIRLLGPVKDAVVELAKAKAAVVPLLTGSGTRVKILEAWAAGTPVVSTPAGAEGLPAVDGEHLLIADQPVDFASAVSSLLASAEFRSRVGQAGRTLFETEFTWKAGWKQLEIAGI